MERTHIELGCIVLKEATENVSEISTTQAVTHLNLNT